MYNIFKYKKYEKIKTENGWTVKSVLWNKNSYDEIAFEEELNSDRLLINVTTYSDENFRNVIRISKREYNQDKSYTQYDTYEQIQNDYQSVIGIIDNKKRIISRKTYSDKNFENLIREAKRKHNKNDSFEETIIDYNTELSAIYFCSKNGIVKKQEIYDKDFKKLKYTIRVKGDFEEIMQVYTEPYLNMLSAIQKNYKNKSYGIGFSDANFKIKYQEAWEKYNKKDEKIKLKTYEKKQEGYHAILTKYDKDENEIYEKKYKFKGILARILYFFAK